MLFNVPSNSGFGLILKYLIDVDKKSNETILKLTLKNYDNYVKLNTYYSPP